MPNTNNNILSGARRGDTTMDFKKIDYAKLGFFRFAKLGKDYLLTNDVGEYVFLKPEEFRKFIAGKLSSNTTKHKELCRKNFVRDKLKLPALIAKYKEKHEYLFSGPGLHIVVVTLRCNYNCVYCQASAKGAEKKKLDMDLKTAKRVVDFIFKSPNQMLAIEFQGGEPLLNWPIVKSIVKYAREKNKKEKRNLEIRLVSNFSLMDEDKLSFFFKNRVALCTSLDGPEELHNKNRPFSGGSSYEQTTKWLGRAMDLYRESELKEKKDRAYIYQPGALITPSRFSLSKEKEIVDEYLKWGFEAIFLRSMNPFGLAGKVWEKIGYSAQEYLDFYSRALDYILELNKQGKRFFERTATIILAKILTNQDPNYLEMRSPCGAGLGQLAYDYNGDIYTCDEGRMMGYIGDKMFRLGNIYKNDYNSIIEAPTLKAMCLASEINSQVGCSQCVYAPYCGVCPIYNYVTQGNIFGQMTTNDRCRVNKGIMEIIFKKLADPSNQKILKKWANSEIRREKLQQSVSKIYE